MIHVTLYLHQQAIFQRKLESFLGTPFSDTLIYDIKGDRQIHSHDDLAALLPDDGKMIWWLKDAGRWVLHGPRLTADQDRPPAYVLHRPRNLADTRRRCAWLADHYAWSIVLWCDNSVSRTLGFITRDAAIGDRFLQADGNEIPWARQANAVVGSYALGDEARNVFPTVVLDEYPEDSNDVGQAVWEACGCERNLPLVTYWHLEDDTDDVRGKWTPLHYDVVAQNDEYSQAVYRPHDLKSFMGMCEHGLVEYNNQGECYVIAVSGETDPAALLELIEALHRDKRTFWSPLSELPRFLEISPWFYNPKPVGVEGFYYTLFSARDPGLTAYVASESRRVFDGEDVTVAFF